MAIQYTSIQEQDFSGGIDTQPAENQIKETYLEKCQNAIADAGGSIKQRSGYITYAGGVPIRVENIDIQGTEIRMTLDNAINVASLTAQPIFVYGRLGSPIYQGSGTSTKITEFVTDEDKWLYVESPKIEVLSIVPIGGTSVISLPPYKTGFTSDSVFVGIAESNRDNTVHSVMTLGTNNIKLLNQEVTASIVNDAGVVKYFSIYACDPASLGIEYGVVTTPTITNPPPASIVISTSTLSLPTNNFMIRWRDSSGNIIILDTAYDEVSGDITVQLGSVVSSLIGTSITGVIVPAGPTSFYDIPVAANALATVNVPYAISGEALFVDVYRREIDGTTYTLIQPDTVTYNKFAAYPLTVTFENPTVEDISVRIYWRAGQQTSRSVITVDLGHAVYASGTLPPQLVVYGPDHANIYPGTTAARPGWVSHIDNYRTSDIDRMVCGLGFNQFHALPISNTTSPGFTHYVNMRARVKAVGVKRIGPALSKSDLRTTSCVTSSDITVDHTLYATTITQNGSLVYFTTNFTGTMSDPGNYTGLGRQVTILQSPKSDLLGTHEIVSITGTNVGANVTSVTIGIYIQRGDMIDFTRYSGTPIEWGIFCDTIEIYSPAGLLYGDKVDVLGFSDTFPNVTCLAAYTRGGLHYVELNGLTTVAQIPNRLLLLGTRTTNTIPLDGTKDSVISPEDFNIVPGDMIKFVTIPEEQRVYSVICQNTAALTVPVSMSVTSSVITMTVDLAGTTHDTASLAVGDTVILGNIGFFSREYVIANFLSETVFTTVPVEITMDDGIYTLTDGYIVGSTVTVHGEPITVSDTSVDTCSVTVPYRWLPIERPEGYLTAIKQYESSYTEQPFVHSVISADTMFLTNGSDPIFKYDGTNYAKVGLPRFNPCVTVCKNTASGVGKISFSTAVATGAAGLASPTIYPFKIFYAAPGSTAGLSIGESVAASGASGTVVTTITNITKAMSVSGASGTVIVDTLELAASMPSNVTKVVPAYLTYKYYFKFLMIDKNNNTIQSATLGSSDIVVRLTESARVEFRVTGFPEAESYDYDRIEIEVYRTKQNQNSPYYLVRNVKVPYPITDYIDIYDSTEDEFLSTLDSTTSSIAGQELSNGLMQPFTASCLTTLQNRLLLAGVTSQPTVSMTWADGPSQNVTETDFLLRSVQLSQVGSSSAYRFTWVPDTTSYRLAITNAVTASGLTTVTCANTLTAGSWVYLTRKATLSGGANMRFAGWYSVMSRTASNIVISTPNLPNSSNWVSSQDVDICVIAPTPSAGVSAIPVWGGQDYFFDTVEGNSTSPTIKFMPRMGRAINSFFSKNQIAQIHAEFGNDVSPVGSLQIRFPSITWGMTLFNEAGATAIQTIRIYVNDQLHTLPISSQGDTFTSKTQFRGSRILRSYSNHPELFDNPWAETSLTSDSVIDVNPSDGENITAMIPLIGPSTSINTQLQSTVIVFKERSIYTVDVSKGTFDKLETAGVGSPFPHSVAYNKDGLSFASYAGIFRIDRTLKVKKISCQLDRLWLKQDLSDVSRFWGHHYSPLTQYRISTTEGNVFVYNYDREIEGKPGAFFTYTNHNVAGGWANQGQKSYFASTAGRVFVNRSTGTVTDHRDDSNTPIALDIKFRAMHFGDATIRKQVRHVGVTFRGDIDATATSAMVQAGFDCSTDFTTLDSFVINSESLNTITTLRFGVPVSRCTYLQVRVKNDVIDQPIELSGVSYRVAGLKVAGTAEAASSRGK